MVLAFFGRNVQEEEIARLLETHWAGTAFRQIARVDALGFDVTLGSGGLADLEAVYLRRTPLIVAVHTLLLPTYPPPGGRHCVVVAGATDTEVAIYDPDRHSAPDIVPATAFDAAWRIRQYRMAVLTPR
jgi:ABC-type bacteriocin/lantibiotic exporter with double-glycine peptidase domain